MTAATDTQFMRPQELQRADFDQQVAALIHHHGASAFAACWPNLSAYTLFVDEHAVIAEPADSPRHRYGAFCELDAPLTGTALTERVQLWLDSGEAFELYVGMNVCRYHCG